MRRGFLIKRHLSTLFRLFFRRNRSPEAYLRLNPIETEASEAVSGLIGWTRHLRTKALAMVSRNDHHAGRGYIRVGGDPVLEKPVKVPKGHVAVYVGQQDGDSQRMLVPLVYINHPLFVDLLKESEKEYGFNHPGGITIPCRISEFERVQTRIKAFQCTRKLQIRKISKRSLMG
ncbi:protein SMALL AUXIN UP-REGULATED RNA 51-like [Henckelia pumila]|uniref:protein SMALL AUXIN UP-REGULATED RNA 51-like n=1 Tax=Henckelia pumila TaxID=405737 RepID=UPI003C6DD9EC